MMNTKLPHFDSDGYHDSDTEASVSSTILGNTDQVEKNPDTRPSLTPQGIY